MSEQEINPYETGKYISGLFLYLIVTNIIFLNYYNYSNIIIAVIISQCLTLFEFLSSINYETYYISSYTFMLCIYNLCIMIMYSMYYISIINSNYHINLFQILHKPSLFYLRLLVLFFP